MKKIDKLIGISATESKRFKKANIETITHVWEEIGVDFYNGIENLAQKVEIKKERLIQLLSAQAESEANKSGGSWLKCHWVELAISLAAIFLALVLYYGKSTKLQEWVYSNFRTDSPIVKQMVVRTKTDLPAFHYIRAEDVQEEHFESKKFFFFPAEKDLLNRFTLKKISAGTAINAGDVSAGEILQNKPVIISFAVPLHSLALAEIGQHISLLLAPAVQPDNIPMDNILINAILLDKKSFKNSGSILVSINEDDLNNITSYIGKSEIILLRSVR